MADLAQSKIMHIAPGHWIGDMRLYHLECHALQKAGFTVEVVAHVSPPCPAENGIRTHSLGPYQPSLKLHMAERIRRARAAYRIALNSGAALFHCHGLDFLWWIRALARETGRPVVFDCREDFEAYARHRRGIPDAMRPAVAHYTRMILRRGAASSDAVVVADDATGAKLAPHARRLLVLYNYPRLELFPPNPERDAGKQYDVVLYGSLPRYHLNVCFSIDGELIKRGHRIQWYFIGRMPDMPWFERERMRPDRAGRFHHSPPVPHDQLAIEVRKARIGIIPLPDLEKFRNNIPQKLFELLALQVPIVMSDLPPGRRFAADSGCAILVPPDRHDAYAEAIIRLLKHPDLRHRMGTAGRKHVQSSYRWDRESPKLLSLYTELLSGRS